jgi:hypothetical protein
MTLQQPSEKDFEPAYYHGYGVSVLFKPTQARYMYKVVNGVLEPGCHIDRRSTDLAACRT